MAQAFVIGIESTPVANGGLLDMAVIVVYSGPDVPGLVNVTGGIPVNGVDPASTPQQLTVAIAAGVRAYIASRFEFTIPANGVTMCALTKG